jgi:hypothetical protein
MTKGTITKLLTACSLPLLLLPGCGGAVPPEGAPAPRAQALVTPSCETPHAIALQKASASICSVTFQGVGGQWNGRPVLQKREAVYCAYTWSSSVGAPPDWPALTPTAVVAIEEDCLVTRPTMVPSPVPEPPVEVDPNVVDVLLKSFRAQAGYVEKKPWDTAHVSVIDSAVHAFADPDHDNYSHGRAMGRIVADLACQDDVKCDGRVHNRLTLPHLTPTLLDPVNGGFFGSRGELAEAINLTVQEVIQSQARDGKPSRRIMNLSVGWDPADDKRYPSQVTDDAVREALTRASCLGILTIAAAGNDSGTSTGPTYPAAWEALPAPTSTECGAYPGGGTKLVDDQTAFEKTALAAPTLTTSRLAILRPAPYRPLLYAAAGVDAVDKPLDSTRPDGRPLLAAIGDRVVTPDPLRKPYHTLILTGTSVATAVVTGAAAAVWGMNPGLTHHQVMDIVYGSAEPLLEAPSGPLAHADFCLGWPTCSGRHVRRVSVCSAVRALDPGIVCDTVPAYGGTLPPDPPPPPPPVAMDGTIGPETTPGSGPAPPWGSSPGDWVLPQPNWPHCKPCKVNSWGTLSGAFDPMESPASGSVVTHIWVSFGGAPWQLITPANIQYWESGFVRNLYVGGLPPGWIAFNVTYVEFGVYVRSYQTPVQWFSWEP